MSGRLSHSPGKILAALLVQMGQASVPSYASNGTYDGGPWPVFSYGDVSSPDQIMVVKTTQGTMDGRTQVDGVQQEHYGFQLKIRGSNEQDGYDQANLIANFLDTGVYKVAVEVGSSMFCVHSISRRVQVLPIGRETPTSKRFLLTINGLVTIQETT